MRLNALIFVPLAALAMSACSPRIPESNPGLNNGYPASPYPANPYATSPYGLPPAGQAGATGGFSTTNAAAAIDRASGGAAAGAQQPYPAPYPAPGQPAQGGLIGGSAPVQTAAAGAGTAAGGVGWNDCSTPEGIAMTTSEMTPGQANAGMSDENDFNAVTGRRSIEGDKRQIECNRAQYQVDQPGALPQRKGGNGPNLAQYALSTTNQPGQAVYRRSGLALGSADAKCARYTSPDKAQEDFLAAGGPERDRKGLDPDGDGFACDWDPRPFRAALQ